jgi:AGCS family alanine or glycine:cation symporter
MDAVAEFFDTISGFVWGPFLLIPLLLGTGLYLTIRLGGLQFTKLLPALSLGLLKRKDAGSEGDISQFQALTTALAATVGTGNIVGVATAIGVGGPGALFWMWMTGLLGRVTKYAEGFLAVRFRRTDEAGEKSGGPQFYLEHGIKGPLGKVLGLMFAIFAVLACFGIGNMTQGNSIAANVESSWSIPAWITGAVLTVLTLVVLIGGIKSIGRVTAGLVPIMIVFYVLGPSTSSSRTSTPCRRPSRRSSPRHSPAPPPSAASPDRRSSSSSRWAWPAACSRTSRASVRHRSQPPPPRPPTPSVRAWCR